jgi:sulfur carrier protein
MYFFINGQKYYSKQELSILELIKYFNYNTSLLVLEYNNFIYNKEKWTNTFIKDKDKIEIITIVGGG